MDIDYWNGYYQALSGVHYPSSFANLCVKDFFPKGAVILELGSGNGRDAFYFAEMGYNVFAIDQSSVVTDQNSQKAKEMANGDIVKFLNGDFCNLNNFNLPEINVVYSRFTIHSINYAEQSKLLESVYELLPKNGLFVVEARSIFDSFVGFGKQVGRYEYVTDHYRRFLNSTEFLKDIFNTGFRLKYFNESDGLACLKDEDPVIVRVVSVKG